MQDETSEMGVGGDGDGCCEGGNVGRIRVDRFQSDRGHRLVRVFHV